MTAVSAAPWWGVPVIAGGFLILGAVLGFLLNRLQDNRRAKREHEQRWYDHIRDLSGRAVATTREYAHRVYSIDEAEGGQDDDDDGDNLTLRFATAYEVFDRLQNLAGELSIAAPKDVNDAMEKILSAAHDLRVAFYRGELAHDSSAAISTAGNKFIEVVRQYLRVDDVRPVGSKPRIPRPDRPRS
ncbi:hypothetical protein AKG07_13700 [Microbacterium sp. CGR1]|nr:hypothetical protein AKG07_13700 [Microbacterium sp. CGR1]